MNLPILKQIVTGLVRTRAMGRHFRRRVLLEALTRSGVSKEVPNALAQTLAAASASEVTQLLAQLASHGGGLTAHEADAIRARVGLNEVEQEKPMPWWLHLWHSYSNPFNLLLTLLALVSYFTDDMKGAIVISTMVVV
jgi:Mg2+-importing ATPase